MKQNYCIENPSVSADEFVETVNGFMCSFKAPFEWLRQYYGHIIGRDISNRQTTLLLNAQVSFLVVISAGNAGWLLQALSVAWFALSVIVCKRSLGRN